MCQGEIDKSGWAAEKAFKMQSKAFGRKTYTIDDLSKTFQQRTKW